MGISISIEESSGTRHGKPVKPNMILPPRRTIPRISNNLKYCEKSPHIGQWGIFKYFGQYFDLSLTCSVEGHLRTYFPTAVGQLPFSNIVFHCRLGFVARQAAQMLRTWDVCTLQFRCRVNHSDFHFLSLMAGNVPTMTPQLRSVLVLQIYLGHSMPTDGKYPCSAKVIDESSSSRSGDASSEFAGCTFTYMCSVPPANYCN